MTANYKRADSKRTKRLRIGKCWCGRKACEGWTTCEQHKGSGHKKGGSV